VLVLQPGAASFEEIPVDGRPAHRALGLAEMALAIHEARPHRASGDLAFHVLDVLCSLQESAETGRHVELKSRCERPEPMGQVTTLA
jgi:hypothetical protein